MIYQSLRNIQNQVLAATYVNIGSITMGSLFSWTAPFSPLLQSNDTPLQGGPLSAEQMGMVGSTLGLSSIFGIWTTAWLGKKIGFKLTLWLQMFVALACWLIVLFARQIEMIFCMRILSGIFCGGMVYGTSIYIAEISDEKIRGRLATSVNLSSYVGMLLIMISGSYLAYEITPIIQIVITTIYGILFAFVPQSPQFLLNKGRIEDAEKSIQFYKNCSPDSERFRNEMQKLNTFVHEMKTVESLTFRDYCTKEARKSFIAIFFFMTIPAFTGQVVMVAYTASIFLNSGSTMDPRNSAIIIIVIQIIGSVCSTSLIDKKGRRFLLIVGCLGAGIGTGTMAIYRLLAVEGFDLDIVKWVPIVSLSIMVFAGCIGIAPVVAISVVEVLPVKLRRSGTAIGFCSGLVLASIVLALFPIITEIYDMYVNMFIFMGYSVVGLLFSIFMMKDTTGKDLFKTGQ